MKSESTLYRGLCHCGNIGIKFESKLRPEQLPVRACSCSFCSSHGVRTTSDPNGSVQIFIRNPDQLSRYRFGLRTADFLVCRQCGVYLAAVLTTGDCSYATVNINTFDFKKDFTQEPIVVMYDGETDAERIARRKTNWTPVHAIVEGTH